MKMKWLMLKKWRRPFHSSHVKFPFINVSARAMFYLGQVLLRPFFLSVCALNGKNIPKEKLLLDRLTSAICFFVDFRLKNVWSLFFGKTVRPQNGLLIFLGKQTHSETKSWKSYRILTKKVTTTTVNPGNRGGFCM